MCTESRNLPPFLKGAVHKCIQPKSYTMSGHQGDSLRVQVLGLLSSLGLQLPNIWDWSTTKSGRVICMLSWRRLLCKSKAALASFPPSLKPFIPNDGYGTSTRIFDRRLQRVGPPTIDSMPPRCDCRSQGTFWHQDTQRRD